MLSLTAIKQSMLQSKMVYYTEAITVKIFCLKSKLFSLVIPAALKSSIKKNSLIHPILNLRVKEPHIYIPCYMYLSQEYYHFKAN